MLCTHPNTSVLQNFVIKLSILPKIGFKSVCVGLEETQKLNSWAKYEYDQVHIDVGKKGVRSQ